MLVLGGKEAQLRNVSGFLDYGSLRIIKRKMKMNLETLGNT